MSGGGGGSGCRVNRTAALSSPASAASTAGSCSVALLCANRAVASTAAASACRGMRSAAWPNSMSRSAPLASTVTVTAPSGVLAVPASALIFARISSALATRSPVAGGIGLVIVFPPLGADRQDHVPSVTGRYQVRRVTAW